ncbi:MAG TPA: hypothetical protein VNW46_02945 [Gemmatimonadaceae bacterium]|jgi:hypothetical protein|nr:hypothetical protein [Gemmatimonadaceae bacterium]
MNDTPSDEIELPAPTYWPMVLAFGLTLVAAGYLMHPFLAVVGGLVALTGAVGWFREVLPVEHHEYVRVVPKGAIPPSSRTVQPLRAGIDRVRLPLEVYPYSVGLKAGIVGGAAMAIVGCVFGVISQGSVWYPINLLAAAAMPELSHASLATLKAFNPPALLFGTLIHGSLSILIGVLYAVLLPIFNRRPILLAGFIVPAMMSGVTWALLRAVNPLLDDRIEWGWFVASQIAFGLVAGFVVSRTSRIPTGQVVPLAVRAGIEGTGMPPGGRR